MGKNARQWLEAEVEATNKNLVLFSLLLAFQLSAEISEYNLKENHLVSLEFKENELLEITKKSFK